MTGFGDLNLKFPLIMAISVFMSSLNFMLSRVEHEESFKTKFLIYEGRLINSRNSPLINLFLYQIT